MLCTFEVLTAEIEAGIVHLNAALVRQTTEALIQLSVLLHP